MQMEKGKQVSSTLLDKKQTKQKPVVAKRLAPIRASDVKNKELVSPSPLGGTLTDSKHGNLDQLEDKAYNSQTNFNGGQLGSVMSKQNSQRAFVSPAQRVPSMQRPPQRSALPAIDQQKQKEKLRKMMGDSVEDIGDLLLNKNPKIGLSTRASYQLGMGGKTLDGQTHLQSH